MPGPGTTHSIPVPTNDLHRELTAGGHGRDLEFGDSADAERYRILDEGRQPKDLADLETDDAQESEGQTAEFGDERNFDVEERIGDTRIPARNIGLFTVANGFVQRVRANSDDDRGGLSLPFAAQIEDEHIGEFIDVLVVPRDRAARIRDQLEARFLTNGLLEVLRQALGDLRDENALREGECVSEARALRDLRISETPFEESSETRPVQNHGAPGSARIREGNQVARAVFCRAAQTGIADRGFSDLETETLSEKERETSPRASSEMFGDASEGEERRSQMAVGAREFDGSYRARRISETRIVTRSHGVLHGLFASTGRLGR